VIGDYLELACLPQAGDLVIGVSWLTLVVDEMNDESCSIR